MHQSINQSISESSILSYFFDHDIFLICVIRRQRRGERERGKRYRQFRIGNKKRSRQLKREERIEKEKRRKERSKNEGRKKGMGIEERS